MTGMSMATSHSVQGFGDSFYLVTAMYYSPGQWCSVGHVIHNLRLLNLTHILGHGSPIYLSLTHSDRPGPSPYLKTVFRNQVPNCPQL